MEDPFDNFDQESFEESWGEWRNKFKKFLSGKGSELWIGVLVVLALILGITTIYSIGPDEVGVIQRFGKFSRIEEPGLHFKLPGGIEKLTKVKTERIFKEEFGFRSQGGNEQRFQQSRQNLGNESLMLTGDLNSVAVEWIVQYNVKDPEKYLFNVYDVRDTIRDITESAMREIVGDRSVDEVLTVGRREVAEKVQLRVQELLNLYQSGINIVTIQSQDVNPPDPVKPAFNEVNEARQEKEKVINQAWEAYNKVIPKAKGEANKLIRNAEAYATERKNLAQGEAARFLDTWRAYQKAKVVTRRRLYIETMEEVLPAIEMKYIVSDKLKQISPFINLTPGTMTEKAKE